MSKENKRAGARAFQGPREQGKHYRKREKAVGR